LLVSFECASLSALLKRTAAITQAGLGSQTIRSGTVAFKTLRCVIEVAYILASVKTITVKFLVWENTTRKELQPHETPYLSLRQDGIRGSLSSELFSLSKARAGLKPMKLLWAPRHGGRIGCSFLPDIILALKNYRNGF